MIDLKPETHIQKRDFIYNPTENVKYLVTSYAYNLDYKTPVAYFQPVHPFGTSKNEFTMPIKSMIDLNYKLIKENKE
jgi:hypothetical protein